MTWVTGEIVKIVPITYLGLTFDHYLIIELNTPNKRLCPITGRNLCRDGTTMDRLQVGRTVWYREDGAISIHQPKINYDDKMYAEKTP